MPPLRSRRLACALAVSAAALGGCGGGSTRTVTVIGLGAPQAPAVTTTGSGGTPPAVAAGQLTKNTARISGSSPAETAAAIALAVYPDGGVRPPAIVTVESGDWRAALAGAVLFAPPSRAPILFTDGDEVPGATASAVASLAPTGSRPAGGAQAIRLGTAGDPGGGLRTMSVPGDDPATLAANVDALRTRIAGTPSAAVVVASSDEPAFAMPAAAWAAKSGDPVLLTGRTTLPAATRNAIRAHGRPRIYILGPPAAISTTVGRALAQLGTVTRISAPTPQGTAIAFARFRDGAFGWGVVDPGHGFTFASPADPVVAGPAAALSASGSYGPLLLVGDDGGLPGGVRDYLLDVKPGYSSDPVRGVYNRGWIVGDPSAVSAETQARIDGLLEIAPANRTSEQP